MSSGANTLSTSEPWQELFYEGVGFWATKVALLSLHKRVFMYIFEQWMVWAKDQGFDRQEGETLIDFVKRVGDNQGRT
jgi:hypothetical protein